jgi:hypothetical protein
VPRELAEFDQLINALRGAGDTFAKAELPMAERAIGRTIDALRGTTSTMADVAAALAELQNVLFDELELSTFLQVPRERVPYYRDPRQGWDDVCEKFPDAVRDVEEAARCLALARHTAAVFHLMRVMELGLTAIASGMGVAYAPSWDSYLRQIDSLMRLDWKDKSPEWKTEEPFYRDVAANLHAVRRAWRNPTMHIVNHYDGDEAEEIFLAVRAFMRHIASKLAQ